MMTSLQEDASEYFSIFFLRITASWQLAKVPLCLLIACSTCFGALVAANVSVERALFAASGVLLLATGAATFNSVQEVSVDRTMRRTVGRPLVQNSVSRKFALLQATLLVCLGLLLLSLLPNPKVPLALGIISLCIYNGVYTRLKQITVLAIIPGAVCGALPPLIGWTAAGGRLLSYMSLLLFSLLFLWQIPHFYLILLRYREDYLQANQPSFLKLLSEHAVRNLSCVWICALALVMMLFSISPAVGTTVQQILLLINGLALAAIGIYYLMLRGADSYRLIFISLNLMLFNHMAIMSIGSFCS